MTDKTISARSISAADLQAALDGAAPPLLFDVRRRARLDESDVMLPAAQWRDPERTAGWIAGTPRSRPIVVYCVHGHEVSQGAAAALRAAGAEALYLEGGIEGWRSAGQPTVRRDTPTPGATYVTRARPKIDRVACPWLIRRFVDPTARFAFVPPGQVLAAAAEQGWIPLDVPDVELSHVGERCSFDACIDKWRLADPALVTLAPIVRGADTGRPDLAPEAAGLLAVSLGLSRRFDDDHRMLEVGFEVYDALYAWAREARDERHNWVPTA